MRLSYHPCFNKRVHITVVALVCEEASPVGAVTHKVDQIHALSTLAGTLWTPIGRTEMYTRVELDPADTA